MCIYIHGCERGEFDNLDISYFFYAHCLKLRGGFSISLYFFVNFALQVKVVYSEILICYLCMTKMYKHRSK